MCRKIFCLLLIILTRQTGWGQIDDFNWMDHSSADNPVNGKITGTKYNYALRGNLNYFYQADWYPGTVSTPDGEVHTGYNLRYDAYNDELVALNTRVKGFFVVDKYLVTSFTVDVPGSGRQIFRKLSLDEFQQKERFYEVLYEGKVTLISRNRITERKTSAYRNKSGKLDDREYRLNKQFLLIQPGVPLMNISPGKKSVLNLFPERKKDLRQLFRRHYIDDFSPDGLPGIIALLEHENYF